MLAPNFVGRYPNTAEFLRKSGLFQVDFAGFKATESHTSVTSMFFDGYSSLKPRHQRQPTLLEGNLNVVTDWDIFKPDAFKRM